MSLSVLVQSSLRTQDFTLLIVVGVGTFVGGWIDFANGSQVVGIVLQVISGLCVAGSAIGLRWRISRRQWTTLNEGGFTLKSVDHEPDPGSSVRQQLLEVENAQPLSRGFDHWDRVRQRFFLEAFAACVIEVKLILLRRPDRSQSDAARSSQDELQAAVFASLCERDDLQHKLIRHEILVTAQRVVNVTAQIVHRVDVSGPISHRVASTKFGVVDLGLSRRVGDRFDRLRTGQASHARWPAVRLADFAPSRELSQSDSTRLE